MSALLPEHLMMRGSDPTLLKAELLAVIQAAMNAHPRSHQVRIGPSEVGTPCQLRLGYRLAGVRPIRVGGAWRPEVGTAVHAHLAEIFARDNTLATPVAASDTRWLVEAEVDVGEIGGVTITGRCDLYDRVTATAVDWKCVGPTTLRAARAARIDAKYRVQAHLYGRGWARAGLPIERVAIVYLPVGGELSEAHMWSEPYDETVALDALAAANTVAAVLAVAGARKALPILTTADDHCVWCPWFMPAALDRTEACPGHRDPPSPLAVDQTALCV